MVGYLIGIDNISSNSDQDSERSREEIKITVQLSLLQSVRNPSQADGIFSVFPKLAEKTVDYISV